MSIDPRIQMDAAKLRTLADWFDAKYPDDPEPEVQRDLRRIARNLETDPLARLSAPETVEAAARALHQGWDETWAREPESLRAEYRRAAERVLAAVRSAVTGGTDG